MFTQKEYFDMDGDAAKAKEAVIKTGSGKFLLREEKSGVLVVEKQKKISMADLANLLHSSVFSLEKSIQETMNGLHIIVTSHAAKYIGAIEEKKGSKLYSNVDLDKAIENFVDHTSDSEFFDELEIKKIDAEQYLVKIEGCALAKTGVHTTLKPENDVCPMALAAGAVLKYVEPDRDVVVKPSNFDDEGSLTEIQFNKII
jgi:hypothetical protein